LKKSGPGIEAITSVTKSNDKQLIMEREPNYSSTSNKSRQMHRVCIVVKTILLLYNSITATLHKKKEIEKCDIVCANCHLKQHYYLGRRQSRVTIEPIADQFARAEEELTPTQNEELAHAIVNNYFPEGIDFASLSDEFYDSPEQ
jgi:hypothetical protein